MQWFNSLGRAGKIATLLSSLVALYLLFFGAVVIIGRQTRPTPTIVARGPSTPTTGLATATSVLLTNTPHLLASTSVPPTATPIPLTVTLAATTDTPAPPTPTPQPTDTPMPTPTNTPTRMPTNTPTLTPTNTPIVQAGTVSKWFARVYNIDELGKVYINDELIAEVNRQRDSGWLDVTEHIIPGQENTLRFTVWNVTEEYTWGFALKGDDTVVWQDVQGQVGFKGANNNDLSKANQTVYDRTLLIDSAGQVSELPGAPSKWYMRLSKIDDIGERISQWK